MKTAEYSNSKLKTHCASAPPLKKVHALARHIAWQKTMHLAEIRSYRIQHPKLELPSTYYLECQATRRPLYKIPTTKQQDQLIPENAGAEYSEDSPVARTKVNKSGFGVFGSTTKHPHVAILNPSPYDHNRYCGP